MSGKLKTLVVVDDDQLDLKMLTRVFEKEAPDISVSTCLGSRDAVDQILDCNTDIALLDINMPGLNGFEVLEDVRKKGGQGFPPVIMLSTSESNEDIERAYNCGASAYVVKPNNSEEFRELARSLTSFWGKLVRRPA